MAKRAGWFHRGGRLRFNFQNLELPELAGFLTSPQTSAPAETPPAPEEKKLQVRTQGTLAAAEGDKAPVKVDAEGGVQATESKTRFIGTAVALLVARAGRQGSDTLSVSRREARGDHRPESECCRSNSRGRSGFRTIRDYRGPEFANRRRRIWILRLSVVCVLDCGSPWPGSAI